MPTFRTTLSQFKPINWKAEAARQDLLELSFSESPYSALDFIDMPELPKANRYPRSSTIVSKKIADFAQVQSSQVCLTNGSDKALRLLAECLIESGDKVLQFEPTFPVFASAAILMGGDVVSIPISNASKNLANILQKIDQGQAIKAVYVANPNNPTGNYLLETDQVEAILKKDVWVIIDEAYFLFGGRTVLALLTKYSNLVIVRSLSKDFGLAGLRIGYLLGAPEVIKVINKVENTVEVFNCSSWSLHIADRVLSNTEFLPKLQSDIKKLKDTFEEMLRNFEFKIQPTQTPFVLTLPPDWLPERITSVEILKKSGILIKSYQLNPQTQLLRWALPTTEQFDEVQLKLNNLRKDYYV